MISTAATFAAIIAGKQAHYIRRFQEEGATDEGSAASLEVLRCDHSAAFQALVDRGVVIKMSTSKYYLDLEATDALASRRRAVMLGVFIVIIILVLLARWGR